MDDDDLRRKLAARDLTSPGITLDEAVRRAAEKTRSPRSSWVPRLAVVALIVWVAVVATQVAVERNLSGLVPPNPSAVAHRAAPSLLVEQKLLLAELLGERATAPAAVLQPDGGTPPARQDSTDHNRSGSLPTRRWRHV